MAQPQLLNVNEHILPTPRELLTRLPQGGVGSSRAQLREQVCLDTQPCAGQHSCAITSGAPSHLQRAQVSDAALDVAPYTISCSLTGQAVPSCLPSAPGYASLRGHQVKSIPNLETPIYSGAL